MTAKPKKSALDVGYLRTATASTLAASVLATTVQEKTQQLVHEQLPQQIAIEHLLDNPYQPRVTMEQESLQQLADTISSQGFQGLLVARPHPLQRDYYQITAGHRRRTAASMAGLKTLPVIVYPWSDQEMITLAATENIQREDLTPLEEGRLFQLMIEQMGMTQVEVAASIKKDRGYVRNRLRLATAPADIQAFINTKSDSLRAVTYLLEIDDEQERASLIEQLLKRTLNTEDLPGYIQARTRSTLPAHHHSADTTRQPEAAATTHVSTNPSPASQPRQHETTSTMNEERVRATRLKTILRSLSDYQKRSTHQDSPPSHEERALLQEIIFLAQEIASSW